MIFFKSLILCTSYSSRFPVSFILIALHLLDMSFYPSIKKLHVQCSLQSKGVAQTPFGFFTTDVVANLEKTEYPTNTKSETFHDKCE